MTATQSRIILSVDTENFDGIKISWGPEHGPLRVYRLTVPFLEPEYLTLLETVASGTQDFLDQDVEIGKVYYYVVSWDTEYGEMFSKLVWAIFGEAACGVITPQQPELLNPDLPPMEPPETNLLDSFLNGFYAESYVVEDRPVIEATWPDLGFGFNDLVFTRLRAVSSPGVIFKKEFRAAEAPGHHTEGLSPDRMYEIQGRLLMGGVLSAWSDWKTVVTGQVLIDWSLIDFDFVGLADEIRREVEDLQDTIKADLNDLYGEFSGLYVDVEQAAQDLLQIDFLKGQVQELHNETGVFHTQVTERSDETLATLNATITYANQAENSAQAASGWSQAAESSATDAANSAQAAQGFFVDAQSAWEATGALADAAAESYLLAKSEASAAGESAQAAAGQAVSASTSAGNAESAWTQAVEARNDAEGAANLAGQRLDLMNELYGDAESSFNVLQASLVEDYYTKTETDGEISSATSAINTSLSSTIEDLDSLSATLTQSYYTKTETDEEISSSVSSAMTTLNNELANTNENVTGNTTALGSLTTRVIDTEDGVEVLAADNRVIKASLRSGANLIPNGRFDTGDLVGWSSIPNRFEVVARGSNSNSAVQNAPTEFVLECEATSSTQTATIIEDLVVEPGDKLRSSIMFSSGGSDRDITWQLRFQFRDADGVWITTLNRTALTTSSTSWSSEDLSNVVVPENTSTLSMYLRLNAGSGRGYITNIRVERSTKADKETEAAIQNLNTTKVDSNEAVAISDQRISASITSGSIKAGLDSAEAAAQEANDLAGGKGRVFVQNSAPPTAERLPQNLWIETTNNVNRPRRWNGSTWEIVQDKAATDALAAANAANAEIITINADIQNIQATKVDAEGAIAAVNSTITAAHGGNVATVSQRATSAATQAGALIAETYLAASTGNGNTASLQLVSFNEDNGSKSVSQIKLRADNILLEGSVSANELAAESISADKLAAQSITARHLRISDASNIIFNSELDDLDGWVVDPQVDGVVNGPSNMDSRRALLIGDGITSNRFIRWFTKVEPGRAYRMSAEIRGGGSSINSTFRYGVVWRRRDGSEFGTDLENITRTNNSPVWVSKVITAPAEAVEARFMFGREQNSSMNATLFIGSPSVRVMADAELIVDGSITAGKVAASNVITSSAQIGDATVDTLQVAGNAIVPTTYAVLSNFSRSEGTGNSNIGTFNIVKIDPGPLYIQLSLRHRNLARMQLFIFEDDVEIANFQIPRGTQTEGYNQSDILSFQSLLRLTGSTGTRELRLRIVRSDPTEYEIFQPTILAQHFRR